MKKLLSPTDFNGNIGLFELVHQFEFTAGSELSDALSYNEALAQ